MKKFIAVILACTGLMSQGIFCYGATTKTLNKGDNNMIEIEEMINHYGDEYIDENLDEKTQQLLIIATMTATQATLRLKHRQHTLLIRE